MTDIVIHLEGTSQHVFSNFLFTHHQRGATHKPRVVVLSTNERFLHRALEVAEARIAGGLF